MNHQDIGHRHGLSTAMVIGFAILAVPFCFTKYTWFPRTVPVAVDYSSPQMMERFLMSTAEGIISAQTYVFQDVTGLRR